MASNRFFWDKGDLERISEDELNAKAIIYNTDGFRPFRECSENATCPVCDDDDLELGAEIAEKIYEKYFSDGECDSRALTKIVACLVDLCLALLPKEITLTKQIWCCARTALWNKLSRDSRLSGEVLKQAFSENR